MRTVQLLTGDVRGWESRGGSGVGTSKSQGERRVRRLRRSFLYLDGCWLQLRGISRIFGVLFSITQLYDGGNGGLSKVASQGCHAASATATEGSVTILDQTCLLFGRRNRPACSLLMRPIRRIGTSVSDVARETRSPAHPAGRDRDGRSPRQVLSRGLPRAPIYGRAQKMSHAFVARGVDRRRSGRVPESRVPAGCGPHVEKNDRSAERCGRRGACRDRAGPP